MAAKSLSAVYRFVFVAIVSVALLIVDHRTATFQPARTLLTSIAQPFYWVLDLPQDARRFWSNYWPNRKLAKRYDQLQFENQRINAELQKYQALEAEKERLLVLLSASQSRSSQVTMLADVVNVSINLFDQQLVINRGNESGVFVGQAVVDARGLLGQVSVVSRGSSKVTLITDSAHSVPVEVLRNGLQGLIRGRGKETPLSVPFLSFQADIEVGDVLVTSGLGGVFPPDHPVAKVTELKAVPGEPFLTIKAEPITELDKVEHVLLLKQTSRSLNFNPNSTSSAPVLTPPISIHISQIERNLA